MILEADKPLSQSLLWQIQRTYFLTQGQQAWLDDVVPHEISCSPYMARSYGQVVLGYLRDLLAAKASGDMAWHEDQPIYVVELGAGTGRLTHHLIHYLSPILEQPPFDAFRLQFVLTDFVPATIAFWQTHPVWQQRAESGLVNFAIFDAEQPAPLQLVGSKQQLTPEAIANPLILLANYFFDSIPMDSFVVEDGQLCANLLTLFSDQAETDLTDPTLWDRLRLAYEAIPLITEPYDDDLYNQILFHYEAHLEESHFSFPKVGLDCLKFWQPFGTGRQLWLTSDRGYSLEESLNGQPDPLPNLHGSFSMMVNYHAISQYVWQKGGEALFAPHYQDNLQVLAYHLGAAPNALSETDLAFAQAVVQQGPDDFFALRQAFAATYQDLSLPQLLSVLRLANFDAALLREMQPALLQRLQESETVWYADVYQAILQTWRQYLPLGEADDFAAIIEPLLREMGIEEVLNGSTAHKSS